MFCPKCGAEIKKAVKWVMLVPSSGVQEAEIKCPSCKLKISLLDESAQDQEGTVEIIYH